MKMNINEFEKELAPLKEALTNHPLYNQIASIDDIRRFMEQHVFAVWDFMSLVKKLQLDLTCTQLPWTPPKHPSTARLINEIVCGEETDVNKDGVIMSHFEMYLQAMEEVGADCSSIKRFLSTIASTNDRQIPSDTDVLPDYVKAFLAFTFGTISSNKTHVIAAVFTFGREDLIPDMFIEMVKNLAPNEGQLDHLIYYLERHIEVDGDEHGPMALQMMNELCQNDPVKIREATQGAKQALALRIKLWDGILADLPSPVLI